MKASYNEKKKQFCVTFTDELKVYQGLKHTTTRRYKTWEGTKPPTKREIAKGLAEIYKIGEQEANESKLAVEKLKNELQEQGAILEVEEEGAINAVHYFLTLDATQVCKNGAESATSTLTNCNKVIRIFREWLKKNYSSITLHKIATSHMFEFFASISDYGTKTQGNFYIYLNAIFKKILIDFEQTDIKYINPFARYTKDKFTKDNPILQKEPFTLEEVRQILDRVVSDKEKQTSEWGNIQMQQKFFIFYMLIVTGWRIGDILTLTWEQINFEKRIITLTHMKTEKSTEAVTKIFITPLMEKVLKQQRENAKLHPFNTHLVFNIRKSCVEITNYEYYSHAMKDYLLEVLREMGILVTKKSKKGREQHNFGIHSFRKTSDTELHLAKIFDAKRITYLHGHEDNTTEGQAYLALIKYPERSTRDMIEYMEDVTKLDFFYNRLIHGNEKAHTDEAIANVWLSSAQIAEMKMNFWTNEAIERLRVAWEKGTNIKIVETAIHLLDTARLRSAERNVTETHVEQMLQMLKWVNIDEAVNKMLSPIK